MKGGLRPGIQRRERILVDRARTIGFLGEDLRVYSTPAMVSDVEYCCLRLIDGYLEPGESSVGAHVSLDHLAATPLGETVEVAVTVSEVEKRKVTLAAEVRDPLALVGRGTHVRVVIDVERHRTRLCGRRSSPPGPDGDQSSR
jgi:fluoroacetyl-CoA thioesterase